MQEYIEKILLTPFERFNWWDVVGLVGQALFLSRFLVQWIASERKQRTVIPVAFWYLSLIGGFITLLYSIHVGRLVFILAFSLNTLIYVRNLYIYYARKTRRKGLQFASTPLGAGAPEDTPLEEPSHSDESEDDEDQRTGSEM